MEAVGDISVGLPKFKQPPAVEVAVGVEFVPVPQLGVVRLVQLHQAWENDFPKVEEQPPLPPAPPPGHGSVLQGLGLQFTAGVPPVRLWMLSNDEHLLVQVQHDRLVLNWRRLNDGAYPSYDHLRDLFRDRWQAFVQEVGSDAVIRPTVAEVTFVNRITHEQPAVDLSASLRSAQAVPLPKFASLREARAQYVCDVAPNDHSSGQLVMTAEPAAEGGLALSVVTRLGLTGDDPDTDQIMDTLELAHTTSVLGFTEITTPEMHAAWGRYA